MNSRGLILAFLVGLCLGLPVPPSHAEGEGPTAEEQYMIELVNRTRLDPAGEAARHGIDLNEGLPAGTLSADPREPLAVDMGIVTAARLHNADLFANFSNLPADHRGSDGRDPTQRVSDQGVTFLGGVAENNSWSSHSGGKVTEADVDRLHALLFKDFTSTFEVVGRGHRKVMLNDSRDLFGIGVARGKLGGKSASLCTQDFVTTTRLHITGVVYADDVKKNGFYNVGEGLGGVNVKAVRDGDGAVFDTTTFSSGGYSVEVPPGTWVVTASEGGGIFNSIVVADVQVTDRNVKLDFVPAKAPPPPPDPVFALEKGLAKLSKKTGAWMLLLKKVAFHPGTPSLTGADLDALEVLVNGASYFGAAERATGVVKTKTSRDTGEVVKLTVKLPNRNKLILDLVKSRAKVILKDAPGFDPTGGDVEVEIRLSEKTGVLSTPAVIVGKKANKAILTPVEGSGF